MTKPNGTATINPFPPRQGFAIGGGAFALDTWGTAVTTHALSRNGWRITSRRHLDHTARVLAAIPVYRANVEANESGPQPKEAT